jgi:putative Mg2+ transporter-C (MgtC) family protein
MEIMPVTLHWTDVVIRLLVTLIIGTLIGYNRSEHGKVAGLRTTVLVCLAACVAMIQVNILLPLAGRSSNSFVMNDLMRLPLGILTGMGFIGGGAILRGGDITVGVTTAATLWVVTVIGLCVGGGQIILGLAAAALALFALWGLSWVEQALPREYRSTFAIELENQSSSIDEIRRTILDANLSIIDSRISLDARNHRALRFELRQTRSSSPTEAPEFVQALGHGSETHCRPIESERYTILKVPTCTAFQFDSSTPRAKLRLHAGQ